MHLTFFTSDTLWGNLRVRTSFYEFITTKSMGKQGNKWFDKFKFGLYHRLDGLFRVGLWA
jgi:hypothetical protein